MMQTDYSNENMLKKVVEYYLSAKNARTSIETTWNESYKRYRGIKENADDIVFVPVTYQIVETILPRLAGEFLNNATNIMSVSGRDKFDDEKAATIQALIKYELEVDRFSLKNVDFYRQALIYGTAIGKTSWKYSTKTIKKRQASYDPYTGGKIYIEVEQEQIVKDNPTFDTVPIYDFYIDPAATSIDDARFCIERKLMTYNEIKELVDNGIWDKDEFEKLSEFEGSGQEDQAKRQDQMYSNFQSDSSNVGLPDKYEVLEYWEDDRVVVVVEQRYVLRNEENPYWFKEKPFVVARYQPLPFEFYGLSVPMTIKDLQDQMNNIVNSRIHNVRLILNRMWIIQEGMVDKKQLKSKAGGVISTRGNINNVILPLPTPDVTSSSYEEQRQLHSAMQNTTGATDYVQGTVDSVAPRQTATEVQSKTMQSATRFQFVFKCMAEESIKIIAKRFLQLCQQYMPEERQIKVLGDKGEVEYMDLTPEDIDGEFDFYLNIDLMNSEQSKRISDTMQFYSILMGNPMTAQMLQPEKTIKSFGELFKINAEKFIISPEEQAQQQQAMQEQMMMQDPMMAQDGGMNELLGSNAGNDMLAGMEGIDPSLFGQLAEQ